MKWGDPDALIVAADARRDPMIRSLMADGVSLHDAEDAVSKAVLAARASRAEDWPTFYAYLNRCARNALVDRYRATVPEDAKARLAGETRLTPDDSTEVLVDALAVLAEVRRLPPRQREAIYVIYDGGSVQDIAEAQGTTYKAAEGVLSSARATVRERIRSAL